MVRSSFSSSRSWQIHTPFMRRCLELAARGRGKVGSGAMVGAVLVRAGAIIAEAWHEGFGEPHAEQYLMKKFEQKIDANDVLYVNLEPCFHSGKTPPCVDAIISRGVRNVVYGVIDPDFRVRGRGIQRLKDAGVRVSGPVLRAECHRLNRGFVSLREKNRPWLTVKMAKTLDGRVASTGNDRLRITSESQDLWSHECLRARHDAILAGIGTVLRDDPQLNIRCMQDSPLSYRIILDPHLNIPLTANVVRGDAARGTIVVMDTRNVPEAKEKETTLTSRGVSIFKVPVNGDLFDFKNLWEALTVPRGDFHGIASILVEGGPRTWKAFEEVADETVVLIGEN